MPRGENLYDDRKKSAASRKNRVRQLKLLAEQGRSQLNKLINCRTQMLVTFHRPLLFRSLDPSGEPTFQSAFRHTFQQSAQSQS